MGVWPSSLTAQILQSATVLGSCWAILCPEHHHHVKWANAPVLFSNNGTRCGTVHAQIDAAIWDLESTTDDRDVSGVCVGHGSAEKVLVSPPKGEKELWCLAEMTDSIWYLGSKWKEDGCVAPARRGKSWKPGSNWMRCRLRRRQLQGS